MLDRGSGQEIIMPLLLPPFHQVSMHHGPQEGCLWTRKWSDEAIENLNLTETDTDPKLNRLAKNPDSALYFYKHDDLVCSDSVPSFSGSLIPELL